MASFYTVLCPAFGDARKGNENKKFWNCSLFYPLWQHCGIRASSKEVFEHASHTLPRAVDSHALFCSDGNRFPQRSRVRVGVPLISSTCRNLTSTRPGLMATAL